MIFDNLKTIFIHIPKTAGTSIQFALSDVKIKGWKHKINHDNSATYLKNDTKKFWRYHKFAVVRNPIEREISLYRHFISKRQKNQITFSEYLNQISKDKQFYLSKRWKRFPNLFEDQVSFITIDDNFFIDQIIRYEDLQNGYDQLCQIIGKESSKLLSLRQHKSKFEISDKEINLIKKIRERDFQMLSY